MPSSCTCGATLVPDARFCHKCGKPQFDEPELEAVAVTTPVVPPPLPPTEIGFSNGTAVRAGFLAALLAVLLFIFPLPFPFLRLTVAFLAAGFFAVYLYHRRTGQKISLMGGARMGWITGVFSFTMVMVEITAGVLASEDEGGFAGILKQQVPPNDAQTERIITQLIQQPAGLAIMMLMMLVFLFIILTVLPTLGGLLGAKVLARE